LIGYALGRALADRTLPESIPGRNAKARLATVVASVLASNAPDLDFVMGTIASDPKLAYLLHHRGHTHTLIAALPAGLLLGLGLTKAYGLTQPAERRCVVASGVLGALLHIGFDALNDYGVHPFFPFDDRWYYGDAVFIVEPLLLATLLPLLLLRAGSALGRGIGGALTLGLLALVWLAAPVPLTTAIAASCGLATCLVAQHRLGARAWPALAGATLVVAVFGVGSTIAKTVVRVELSHQRPSEALGQLMVSPMPANPVCWSTLAATLDAQGTYRVRMGSVSLLPSIATPDDCRFRAGERTTAPLMPDGLASADGRVRFERRFEAPIASLHALRRTHCDAEAALRFLRAPYWTTRSGEALLGDLRYDREPELGFAELSLHGQCRDSVPPWVPPLAAWLD
jgi:inner membrane protein